MDQTFSIATDTATLAFFDPHVLKHRLADDGGWWTHAIHETPEVATGRIAVVSVGGDGVYRVRVTDGDLSREERAYAVARIEHLGAESSSGTIFVTAGEWLPGDGRGPDETAVHRVPVPRGLYDLVLYLIAWDDSPTWFTEAGSAVPDSAPPDFVVVFTPRTNPFVPSDNAPRVTGIEAGWVYPDEVRILGPIAGMELSTSVVKRRTELVLKPCGPLDYRPTLDEMDGLAWKDRILVRVLSVNHERKEMLVELVRKISG